MCKKKVRDCNFFFSFSLFATPLYLACDNGIVSRYTHTSNDHGTHMSIGIDEASVPTAVEVPRAPLLCNLNYVSLGIISSVVVQRSYCGSYTSRFISHVLFLFFLHKIVDSAKGMIVKVCQWNKTQIRYRKTHFGGKSIVWKLNLNFWLHIFKYTRVWLFSTFFFTFNFHSFVDYLC